MTMWLGDHNDVLPPGDESTNNLGLWTWQWPEYDAASNGSLVYYLSTYLGYPYPAAGTTNIAKVMICPGFASTVSTNDLSHVSMYNLDGHTSDIMQDSSNPNGSIVLMPFGYPTSGPPAPTPFGVNMNCIYSSHKITEVGAVTPLNPVWYICDMDSVGSTSGGVAGVTIPATPSHGSVRNYVYFDGSVAAHKVKNNAPWNSFLYKP